jgi:hypothetical protein
MSVPQTFQVQPAMRHRDSPDEACTFRIYLPACETIRGDINSHSLVPLRVVLKKLPLVVTQTFEVHQRVTWVTFAAFVGFLVAVCRLFHGFRWRIPLEHSV